MTDLTDGLWPDDTRRPARRLAAAMLLAPLLLSTLLTLLVLFIATMHGPDPVPALTRALNAAFVFTGTMAGFTVTFGATGIGILWITAQRSVLVWLAAGMLLGVIFAMGHDILTDGVVNGLHLMFAGALGGLLFSLIRWIAGIRD